MNYHSLNTIYNTPFKDGNEELDLLSIGTIELLMVITPLIEFF